MKPFEMLVLALTLSSLTNPSLGGTPAQELVSLHPAVGSVIDADENRRFHLFGEKSGFLAAKLYFTSTQTWMLHLFGERSGVFWVQTVRLNSRTKMNLYQRITAIARESRSDAWTTLAEPAYEVEAVRQDSIVTIELLDKTTFVGAITTGTPDTVRFVTTNGVSMDIPESKILEIKAARGKLVRGTFLKYDSHHDRLFFAPTGRTLQAGQVNFSDFYVVFPSLSFGVTDYFMIGGGVSLIPAADAQLFYFSPKLRLVHQENLDLAVGLLYMGLPRLNDFGSAFTALTLGTPLGGVTLGLAAPFLLGGQREDSGVVAVLLGAEKQLSNRVKLITENWILTTDRTNLFLSGGFRFIGNGLTVGFGVFTHNEVAQNGFPFIPWLDFSLALR